MQWCIILKMLLHLHLLRFSETNNSDITCSVTKLGIKVIALLTLFHWRNTATNSVNRGASGSLKTVKTQFKLAFCHQSSALLRQLTVVAMKFYKYNICIISLEECRRYQKWGKVWRLLNRILWFCQLGKANSDCSSHMLSKFSRLYAGRVVLYAMQSNNNAELIDHFSRLHALLHSRHICSQLLPDLATVS